MRNENALVSLSGGQDSMTCLAYALQNYGAGGVAAVSFDYGQRHHVELDAARELCVEWAVPHQVLGLGSAFTVMGAANLTNPDVATEEQATAEGGNLYATRRGLPSSFVPGRNVVLLGYAAASAAMLGADTLITGVCAMDRAGYPDCRAEFVSSLQTSLQLALDHPAFQIDAPLLHRTKAQTFKLAYDLDVLDVILERSHTCYEGDRSTRWPWGYGCGDCPACKTRAAGWQEFESVTLPEAQSV